MRRTLVVAALIALCASGAQAWEFSPDPICTLSHATDEVEVAVTFDPATGIYAIDLALRDGVWPEAPVFGIAYAGGMPLTITTDRHVLSDEGRKLRVEDRGFGNVLNGIAFNASFTALAGDRAVSVPTQDAAEAVERFRDCPTTALS